ncbi:MAG: recombinase, partial [Marivirga sp.]|nr:recombinase [Marivirga sp.]
MNKTISVHFRLKKRSSYVSGQKMPIYLRLTIDGKRTEFSTQREIDPTKWNSKAGRAIATREETRQLNSFLETMQAQIYEAQRELLNKGREVTIKSVRNKMLGIEEEVIDPLKNKGLISVYREHVKLVCDLVGREYAKGTLKRFKAAFTSMEAFMKYNNKEDIKLRDLNYQFITDYEFFLKTIRNVEHNTAMGIIKKLKKIVRISVAHNWIEKDPFMNYKVKIRDTNRPFLLQDELDRIINKPILTERLSQVRDIFVFCCYTGLAYADVQKLRRVDVVIGHDGEKWIHTERVKTETSTRVPLLPQAMKIMDTYKDHPQCVTENKLLPVMSNQKMNEYLKEIAERCEINKKMTFHTARHTFATTVTLTNGVPIE